MIQSLFGNDAQRMGFPTPLCAHEHHICIWTVYEYGSVQAAGGGQPRMMHLRHMQPLSVTHPGLCAGEWRHNAYECRGLF